MNQGGMAQLNMGSDFLQFEHGKDMMFGEADLAEALRRWSKSSGALAFHSSADPQRDALKNCIAWTWSMNSWVAIWVWDGKWSSRKNY